MPLYATVRLAAPLSLSLTILKAICSCLASSTQSDPMCGRYALTAGSGHVRAQVEDQMDAYVGAWEDEDAYNDRTQRGYNIPPRTRNVIVLRGGDSGGHLRRRHRENDETPEDAEASNTTAAEASEKEGPGGQLVMKDMTWGLVPHWMKRQPDHATSLKTINARDDTIVEGGSMWRSIRGRKRCIVLAEGFYEWLKKSSTERVPHHIKRKDGKLMCMAGLYDSVTYEGEKEALETYTIITTNSNKQLSFLHDRMPVILNSAEDMLAWLETPASGSEDNWSPALARLLKPFDGELEIYVVPKEVGKVGNQSADFLKPIAERKGNISSFFAKQQQKADGSPTKKENSPDAKPTRGSGPSKADPASAGRKGKGEAKLEGDDEQKKATEFGLPLNPDDGDKVKPASQAKSEGKKPIAGAPNTLAKGGQKSGKGASRPIVIDDKPTSGKAAEPIVLDDDDDDDRKGAGGAGSKASSRTSLKRSRKSTKDEGDNDEHTPRKNQRTEASGQTKAVEGHESTTDGEADADGNAKLTSFFEIKDADEG